MFNFIYLHLYINTNDYQKVYQMSSEVKENFEVEKTVKRLPVPFKKRTRKILITLQGEYQARYGKKIILADMAGLALDQTIKHFSWD